MVKGATSRNGLAVECYFVVTVPSFDFIIHIKSRRIKVFRHCEACLAYICITIAFIELMDLVQPMALGRYARLFENRKQAYRKLKLYWSKKEALELCSTKNLATVKHRFV